MDIDGALYARLAADLTLTGLLSSYQGLPAIFTDAPIPDDAELPYLIITPVSDVPDDTLNEEHRQVLRDVAVYTRRTGSSTAVQNIAARVRELLHRQVLPLAGFNVYDSACVNLTVAPTDRTVTGRIVSFRFSVQKL